MSFEEKEEKESETSLGEQFWDTRFWHLLIYRRKFFKTKRHSNERGMQMKGPRLRIGSRRKRGVRAIGKKEKSVGFKGKHRHQQLTAECAAHDIAPPRESFIVTFSSANSHVACSAAR